MSNYASVSYLAPPLIASTIAIGLMVLVLRNDRRSQANRIFSLVLLSVAVWGILIYLMRASPDNAHALFWDEFVVPAPLAMEVFYYHFSLIMSKMQKQRHLLRLSYLVLAVSLVLGSAGVFVSSINVRSYGYSPVFTVAIIPFFLFGFLLVIGGLFNLAKAFRGATRYEERNRLLLMMIGVAFPVLLGGVIDIFMTVFPASIYGAIVFCLVTAVAILKYHLLDVRVVFRKTLTYLLASSLVAVPYTAVLFLVTGTFRAEMQPWWLQVAVILLLAVALRPIYGWAQRTVDKAFYRERYDSLKALLEFSRQTYSVKDLDQLGATLVKLVTGALMACTVSLLLRSEANEGFILRFSSGPVNSPHPIRIGESSPLVRWMERRGDLISSTDISTVPQLQGLSAAEKHSVEALGAEQYVPIMTKRGQLAGILVLGRKRSEQFYSIEDKQLLTAVSGQMGIALDNALLYRETKESERALRNSEEKLRLVFNSVSDGIIVLDVGGNILQVNDAVLGMHGYHSGQELDGRNVLELVAEKSRAKVAGELKRLLKFNNPRQTECLLVRKDKSEFPGQLAGVVVKDTSDSAIRAVVVTRDMTEHEQAEKKERQLQQELQLSDRLASVGRLVSGVAHEINNPLTAILGFSQRCLRKNTDKTIETDLKRIHSEAMRVAKVVEDLRTFARRREPHKEAININDILQKALDVSSLEAKSENIVIVREFGANLPMIVADSHQIQQVFLNIIMNAKQAITEAKHGGRLTIKTSKEASFVKIVFTDDGSGISSGNLNKLFEPFFTTRGDRGGIGLGLSICHGIVRDHGGRVYATSKLGDGTTFFVELPLPANSLEESMTPQGHSSP